MDLEGSLLGLSAISNLNLNDDFDISEASGYQSALFAGKLETIDENPTSRRINGEKTKRSELGANQKAARHA